MLSEEKLDMLKSSYPFLNGLSEGEIENVKKYSLLKEIAQGETVFLKGDTCSFFSLILKGRVRVYKTGETGREITLYRFQTGESCILTASCILSKNNFPAEAVVEEDVEAVLIPNELLREFVKQYEPWRKYFFDVLSMRLGEVMEIIDEVVFRKRDTRIAEYLMKHSSNDEVETTHQQIAAELGTSREVVSRILKDFERDNTITIDRGKIVINNPLQLNSKQKS